MSATIRIKIMGGTDIKDAYYDCENVSIALGGMPVETVFDGVDMLYHYRPVEVWEVEYYKEKFGKAKKGDEW